MTIEEMHIAVNLGVQKIASFQVDNLLPQEIDHELNNSMNRFIKQRYSPMGNKYRRGFEQSQKRIDDLRALVVDSRTKCFYVGESLTGYKIDRAPLPMDYMFLVNAVADNYQACNNVIEWKFDEDQTFKYKQWDIRMTPPPGAEGYKLGQLKFGDAVLIASVESDGTIIGEGLTRRHLANWYNFIQAPGTPPAQESNSSGEQSGFDSDFLEQVVVVDSDPYWRKNVTTNSAGLGSQDDENTGQESFDLFMLQGSERTPTMHSNLVKILIKSAAIQTATNSSTPAMTAVWYNPTDQTSVTQTIPCGTPSQLESIDDAGKTNRSIKFRAYDKDATVPGVRSRDRMWFAQHDDLYAMFSDPFNTTSYDKIKYTIQENFIDVHSDETFFTTFVDVKYIRHPKFMNKGLGIGCELPEHTHQEIVELAIQSILEAISDPRYNSQSREVLESE